MESSLLKTGRFTIKQHIKRSVDFQRLFKTGNRVSINGAKLFFMPNNLEMIRIGFPLPRGYGNAVSRNASKRYSREAFRILQSHLNTGYDLLLLVYPGNDSFRTRCEQLQELCLKAGLLASPLSQMN